MRASILVDIRPKVVVGGNPTPDIIAPDAVICEPSIASVTVPAGATIIPVCDTIEPSASTTEPAGTFASNAGSVSCPRVVVVSKLAIDIIAPFDITWAPAKAALPAFAGATVIPKGFIIEPSDCIIEPAVTVVSKLVEMRPSVVVGSCRFAFDIMAPEAVI